MADEACASILNVSDEPVPAGEAGARKATATPSAEEANDAEAAWLEHQLNLVHENEFGYAPETRKCGGPDIVLKHRQWFLLRWMNWTGVGLTRLELNEVCRILGLPASGDSCDACAYTLALHYQLDASEAGTCGMGFFSPEFVDPHYLEIQLGRRRLRLCRLRVAPVSHQ